MLGDPQRRNVYDRRRRPIGHVLRERNVTAEPIRPRRVQLEPLIPEDKPVHLDDLSISGSFRTFSPSIEEKFDRLWRNYSPSRPEMDAPLQPTVKILISPRQPVRGGRVRLLVPAP